MKKLVLNVKLYNNMNVRIIVAQYPPVIIITSPKMQSSLKKLTNTLITCVVKNTGNTADSVGRNCLIPGVKPSTGKYVGSLILQLLV